MGSFVGIVGRIIEHVPFAISMVERFVGKGGKAAKKLSAANEILEFVGELVKENPVDEWEEVDALAIEGLVAALEDEKVFVAKISAVNDAVVDLVNYINSKTPVEDE